MLLFQATSGLLREVLQNTLNALPKVASALVIFIIGWIFAKFISSLARKLLLKTKVDNLVKSINEIDFISNLNIQVSLSNILSKILYYVIMLIALIASTDVLGMPVVSNLVKDLINYIPYLLSAVIVFSIGIVLADFIKNIVATTCKSLGIPSGNILASFIFYFIFLMITISALEQAKINTDFIKSNLKLIVGGVVLAFAVGYGFASRSIMANLMSSLYTKHRFKVGDTIKIGEQKGKVTYMDSGAVTLKTEKKRIIIPMSQFSQSEVEIFDDNA